MGKVRPPLSYTCRPALQSLIWPISVEHNIGIIVACMPATRQLYTVVELHVSQFPIFSKSYWSQTRYRPSQVYFTPKTPSGHIELSDWNGSDAGKHEKQHSSDLESGSGGSSRNSTIKPRPAVPDHSTNGRRWSVDACGVLQVADEVKVGTTPLTTPVPPERDLSWLGKSSYSCKIEGGVATTKQPPSLQSSQSVP